MKDKAFEVLSWASRKLRGTGLKSLPGVEKAYDSLYRILEPENSIRLVDVGDFEMYVDTRDVGGITPNIMKKRGYHPFMIEVLKDLVKPGMTCVDVGANIGYFTVILSRLVYPTGSTFAFEPEPKNYNALAKNAWMLNSEVPYSCIPIRMAASNKVGRMLLNTTGYNFGGHSFRIDSKESIEVELTTLDSYFGDYPVHFVKIDVEGYEPEVIEGMSHIIENNPKLIIILEHMPGLIDSKHLQNLEDKGFNLYELSESRKELVSIRAFGIERAPPEEVIAYNILARRP